jgi:hypothetical protein
MTAGHRIGWRLRRKYTRRQAVYQLPPAQGQAASGTPAREWVSGITDRLVRRTACACRLCLAARNISRGDGAPGTGPIPIYVMPLPQGGGSQSKTAGACTRC